MAITPERWRCPDHFPSEWEEAEQLSSRARPYDYASAGDFAEPSLYTRAVGAVLRAVALAVTLSAVLCGLYLICRMAGWLITGRAL